ncbi:hypothetical protein KJ836_00005 [Patescibacteria group bacterium]|nr:hypothetical protein [Patescibacteria group bacterium]
MQLNLCPVDLSPEFQKTIPEDKPGERSGIDQAIPIDEIGTQNFPAPVQTAILATLAAGGNVTFYPWNNSFSGGTSRYKNIHGE